MNRTSGILLHVSSLPGGHGTGDLGPAAYRWVDFLSASRQQYWQILPLNPVGFGNSPYASRSSFAGEPLLISLEQLAEDGLLSKDAIKGAFPDRKTDYETTRAFKDTRLKEAFKCFESSAVPGDYQHFLNENQWVFSYAKITAEREKTDSGYLVFQQYLFEKQWARLKSYANQRGIRIIGDMPMYVASDSIECIESPQLFDLSSGYVAGAPPCNVHPNGQKWGNPLYRWECDREQGFRWWMRRCKAALKRADILRLDYFCGYHASWATNGTNGHWREGPRDALFETVKREAGNVAFIAEDLGMLTPDIHNLRDRFGITSTKVLQFAFDGMPENPYLPDNYTSNNCVVYTGTHDNDTTRGWFEKAPEQVRNTLRQRGLSAADISWEMIKLAARSRADLTIIPYQDVLCLGSEARINTPGTVSKQNWSWRITDDQMSPKMAGSLEWLAKSSHRLPVMDTNKFSSKRLREAS